MQPYSFRTLMGLHCSLEEGWDMSINSLDEDVIAEYVDGKKIKDDK